MIPLDGVEQVVLEHVPREVTITVTSSPSRGIEATLGLAEALARHGYRVVPHVAARLVASHAELAAILTRIEALGSGDVFVVAGDAARPRGPFESAYPESHAFISDEATIQAMFDKVPFATYIVSQICFDAVVIAGWIRRVRDRGVELPIHVGLPGPTDAARLLRLSRRIGLGESSRFLRRHGSWLGRLTLPRGYRPERLLDQLAGALAREDSRVEGLHLFSFNEVAAAERWRREQLARVLAGRGRPEQLAHTPAERGRPEQLARISGDDAGTEQVRRTRE